MSFARHQTFHLRAGWLAKVMEAFGDSEHLRLFNRPDAAAELGIGKNMVQALRFWVKAAGVVEIKRNGELALSSFGKVVSEYDPFFELDLTWWLIHMHLASKKSDATAWYFLFNKYPGTETDRESFVDALERYQTGGSKAAISRSSFYKDFDCILGTYVLANKNSGTPEDNIICPLTRLGLVDQLRNGRVRKVAPVKDIPLSVVFAVLHSTEVLRLMVSEIEEVEGNLAKTFNLSIDAIYRYLDLLKNRGLVAFSRTAGIDTVVLEGTSPWDIIRAEYKLLGGSA